MPTKSWSIRLHTRIGVLLSDSHDVVVGISDVDERSTVNVVDGRKSTSILLSNDVLSESIGCLA